MNFTTRYRRSVLFYSALVFLLQSITPAFQPLMANTVPGYTEIICTMYGTKKVFVKLGDEPQKSEPNCTECPLCIVQNSLNEQLVAHAYLFDTSYFPALHVKPEPRYLLSASPLFSAFLVRAPPA